MICSLSLFEYQNFYLQFEQQRLFFNHPFSKCPFNKSVFTVYIDTPPNEESLGWPLDCLVVHCVPFPWPTLYLIPRPGRRRPLSADFSQGRTQDASFRGGWVRVMNLFNYNVWLLSLLFLWIPLGAKPPLQITLSIMSFRPIWKFSRCFSQHLLHNKFIKFLSRPFRIPTRPL